MKKTLLYIAASLTMVGFALAQNATNNVTSTNIPTISAVTVTNVVTRIPPIVITREQMQTVIDSIQSMGVSSAVPITASNLNYVSVRAVNGGSNFVVTLGLH